MSAHRRRLSGLLLLVLLAVASALNPSSAHAATPAGEIVLTGLTADDDGLELTLTVTNTGDTPLYTAEVMLWRQATTIRTQSALSASLAADPAADTGGRLGWPHTDAYQVLSADDATFAVGDSRSVTLSATWEELDLTDPGVYLVGAQLYAAPAAGGDGSVVARARTLVVRPGDVTAERVTVVALTSQPSLLTGSEFLDDHLAQEMAPRDGATSGGRLTELAYAAARAGTVWYIDPALYHAAQVMAAGYTVRQPEPAGATEPAEPAESAETVPGQGAAAAAQWLALVDALPGALGYRTLWGDPDLVLAGQLGDPTIVTRAATAWDEALAAEDSDVTRLAALPLLVHPAGGRIDAATWALLPDLGEVTVLATSDGSVAAAPALVPTLATSFAPGPGPDIATTTLQYRQRALAEDYLNAAAGRPSVRVLTTVADAALSAGPVPAWVHPVALADVTAGQGAALAQADAPQPVLTGANRDAVAALEQAVLTFADLTGDPAAVVAVANGALTASLSQDWAGPAAALAYTAAAEAILDAALGQVQVGLVENIIMTAHDTSFPVSIANNLDHAIQVRLVLASDRPLRLSADYPDVIAVDAGDRVTIPVTPRILDDGDVTVTASLATESGRPFGQSVSRVIEINQSGRLAWIIVIVSGVVLTAGTVLRVKTVQRSRRRAADAAGPADAAEDPAGPGATAAAPPASGGADG